jgi:hypothetical protein
MHVRHHWKRRLIRVKGANANGITAPYAWDQHPLTSRTPDALQERSRRLTHCGHVQAPEAINVRTRSEEQGDDASVARLQRKLQSSLTPRINGVNESSVIEQQLHSFWLL